MGLEERIFPIGLSAFSPCCHLQNSHLLSTTMHGRDAKQGFGFSPQIEGCVVQQYLWQEDGFRCADLACLQLFGFARFGLARSVFVYTCTNIRVRNSHPPLCRPGGLKDQMHYCPLPFSFKLATLHKWPGNFFYFFFLSWPVSALYQKSKLKGPQELKGDTPLRWVQKAPFCTCVVWRSSVVAEEVAAFLYAAGGYSAHRAAQLCSSLHFSLDLTVLPKTRAGEPFVIWDPKPLVHVTAQTRVC